MGECELGEMPMNGAAWLKGPGPVAFRKQGRFADVMILYVGKKAPRIWHKACKRDGALCASGKLRKLCGNGTVYKNVSRRRLFHRFLRTNHLIINLSSTGPFILRS